MKKYSSQLFVNSVVQFLWYYRHSLLRQLPEVAFILLVKNTNMGGSSVYKLMNKPIFSYYDF
ncbi:hypothetical protein FC093_22055 [Ilyomonas limi]|uniref:Uncharacterized protein n=1 Tax=Ilyomonas limi TaxID=2575867 RepID=A0A4U3KQQ3_9BACT|nr:hypothetical protein [Ilyomonas limi]TKK64638.1 hypothetical protein FC093_22055 [Ilyomonas limi]